MTSHSATDALLHKGDGLQVVVGLGQSGLSVARYLSKQGYQVAVTDSQATPSLAGQLPDEINIRQFGTIDAELLASRTYYYKPWYLTKNRSSCCRAPCQYSSSQRYSIVL